MKIVGILRGFPGLGRVVAGYEILLRLREYYDAKLIIFTYLQGVKYIKDKIELSNIRVNNKDISSIGIIPVSTAGEEIIQAINEINPDLIMIDGEPLMLNTIKICYPKIKIVTLLNPYDVDNPFNQGSSQKFFNHYFSQADLAIVHGLWKVDKPLGYNSFYSINTIIRKEVTEIVPNFSKKKISCILGGGTVFTDGTFYSSTFNLALKCIDLANKMNDHEFHLMCGSEELRKNLEPYNGNHVNLTIHSELKSPYEMYFDSNLVIARLGRNTISELLYLGIPAVLFGTKCQYRGSEQNNNGKIIMKIKNDQFVQGNLSNNSEDLVEIINSLLTNDRLNQKWESGNVEALRIIVDFLDD